MASLNMTTIIGARPQFIKAAAVSRAIEARNARCTNPRFEERIVHTGQHYNPNMSQVFFDELQIPPPAVNLEVGSDTHGAQTGRMLKRLEKELLSNYPNYVLIYGDTNSTLAGALAAIKLHIPVAHVEAGLRSFNRRMPEEINRILADRVSSLLFCPTETAANNLAQEGITQGVHHVGDVMYDSVLFNAELAKEKSDILARLGLEPKAFYLATVHRAENTDDSQRLASILDAFSELDSPVVLPMHPRTRKILGRRLYDVGGRVRLIDPVPYLDMLMLEKNARIILTDSGGVQKEAYWFDVPCVTLRDETEWVELVEAGVNRLAGASREEIIAAVESFESNRTTISFAERGHLFGDGHAAEKITLLLVEAAGLNHQ